MESSGPGEAATTDQVSGLPAGQRPLAMVSLHSTAGVSRATTSSSDTFRLALYRAVLCYQSSVLPRAMREPHEPSTVVLRLRTLATTCYTVNRLRPFARRALIVLRPARVDILARKPCLRFRFRLLGWKVRFTGNRVAEKGCAILLRAPRGVNVVCGFFAGPRVHVIHWVDWPLGADAVVSMGAHSVPPATGSHRPEIHAATPT